VRGADFEMIKITKVDGGYSVYATSPHVKTEWQSDRPMNAKDIMAELLWRGVHQSDIRDAFVCADPNWTPNLK
jgi:hypothetical protein